MPPVSRTDSEIGSPIPADESLTEIRASDGRLITFAYPTGGVTATAHAAAPALDKTWTYSSSSSDGLRVTLPDGSYWTAKSPQLRITRDNDAPYCDYPGSFNSFVAAPIQFTMRHPSGAVGVFEVAPVRHKRNQVENPCHDWQVEDPYFDAGRPIYYENFALVKKSISGPGIPTLEWALSYSPGVYGSYAGDNCSTFGPCTSTTTVTNPDLTKARYTFGTQFYIDEGKLLRTEVLTAAGATVRNESTSYATNPVNPPYAFRIGTTDQEYGYEDAFGAVMAVPLTSTTIAQDGATFSKTVNSFNQYAAPANVTRSSSLGFSRTDSITYYHDYSRWVIGQVASSTNTDTGLVESATEFYASNALPYKTYSFGKLQRTLTYNPDGTLDTAKDGLNRLTRLSNWKRGLPQLVEHPDTATQSAVVDDFGWVRSTTDERTNTTSYGYDAVGRTSSITYPTSDTVAWLNPAITYQVLAGAELGVAAGSWRREETLGSFRDRTYFDAQLRPVLQEQMDTSTSQPIYRRHAYDFEGRETFSSYPASTSAASAGVNTTFDALGRPTKRQTTDGIVLEQIAYLTGNRKQVTDADGKITTVSYQSFGQPDESRPTLIVAPEGQTTTIVRDTFGKLSTVTQAGLYAGATVTATRSFKYDIYQRPCRRIDPESGSTVWGYDDASQVAWEAKGQSGTDCLSVAPAGATAFQYWPRGNRKVNDYPNTAEDVSYVYDAALNLTSVSNSVAAWTYSYNKRNLVETEQAAIDGRTFLLDPAYNNRGQLSSLTTPGRTFSYAPDAWGRPKQLATWVTSVQYHPNGLASGYSLANGLTYSQGLDSFQRPNLQTTLNGTAIVQKYAYAYYNSGDLKFLDDQGPDNIDDANLTYDNLHRLKTATGLWGGYTYTYDPLNNIRTRTSQSGSANLAYSYDATSNLLSAISGSQARTYSYNPRGEINADGTGKTFKLNSLGQIGSISGLPRYGYSSGIVSYSFDGNGKRIKTSRDGVIEYALYNRAGTLVYTYRIDPNGGSAPASAGPEGPEAQTQQPERPPVPDPVELVDGVVATVTDLAGSLQSKPSPPGPPPPPTETQIDYLNLNGVMLVEIKKVGTTTTATYLHPDLLGSPRKATNSLKNIVWQEHYDPYGLMLNGGSSKIGYTGHAYDAESGYTYMQARFYDPMVGRFLSMDPIGFQDGSPFTFNRYSYANNNPYRYTDPSGMRSECGTGTHIKGANAGGCEVAFDAAPPSNSSSRGATSANGGPNAYGVVGAKLGEMDTHIDNPETVGTVMAVGATVGAAAITADVAAPYLAAGIAATSKQAKNVWNKLSFDGPNGAFKQHGEGRIAGVRWNGGQFGIRLDFHPLSETQGRSVLHLNWGPAVGSEANHFVLSPPFGEPFGGY